MELKGKLLSVIVEPEGDYAILNTSPACQTLVFNHTHALNCWSGIIFDTLVMICYVSQCTFTAYRAEYFGKSPDTWQFVEDLIANQSVDISGTLWSYSDKRMKYFYYFTPAFVSSVERSWHSRYIIVDRGDKGHGLSVWETIYFNNVFVVFDTSIWICLLVGLGIFAVIAAAWNKIRSRHSTSFSQTFFDYYRLSVSQADVRETEMDDFSRIVTLLWGLVIVVIAASFSGMVYMATTVKPGWVQPFNDLFEMQKAGYK